MVKQPRVIVVEPFDRCAKLLDLISQPGDLAPVIVIVGNGDFSLLRPINA